MNRSPLVSIIMPFYDTPPAFMREAVESVLAQTYGNWELLMVDDGSGPESTAVARQFAAEHPERIRYLEHPGHANRGISASRQLAVLRAQGALFGILDADDLWLPEKLEEQVAIMTAHPGVGVCYGNTRYWHSWTGRPEDADADYVPDLGLASDTTCPPPDLLRLFLRGVAAIPCTCSLIVTRQAMELSGGFDPSYTGMYEDQVFYARLCLRVAVRVSDRTWDWYRQHPGSICHATSRDGDVARKHLDYLRWLADYVRRHGFDHPGLRRDLAREIWMYSHPRWLPAGLRDRLRWLKKWALRAERAVLPGTRDRAAQAALPVPPSAARRGGRSS